MPRKIEIATLRTTAELCTDPLSCESIHALADRPGRRYVISKRVTDADELAAFAPLMADDEVLGYIPDSLIPEV